MRTTGSLFLYFFYSGEIVISQFRRTASYFVTSFLPPWFKPLSTATTTEGRQGRLSRASACSPGNPEGAASGREAWRARFVSMQDHPNFIYRGEKREILPLRLRRRCFFLSMTHCDARALQS